MELALVIIQFPGTFKIDHLAAHTGQTAFRDAFHCIHFTQFDLHLKEVIMYNFQCHKNILLEFKTSLLKI